MPVTRRLVLWGVGAVWAMTAAWQTNKPLPSGAHVQSEWYPQDSQRVSFIADITSADAYGRAVLSQGIFDQVLAVASSARRFVVLDYFLFNGQLGAEPGSGPAPRNLSAELRDALIEQRRAHPDLKVLLITDPINEVYGGTPSSDMVLLRAAGIDVVVTNLDVLRDPNFLYSSLWRLAISWWSGSGHSSGWLPNPLDEDSAPISFGAWARLLNFKSNHRKVIIADDGHGGITGIVGSANPHDASSANSNAALRIAGPVLQALLESELAVARFSGWKGRLPGFVAPSTSQPGDDTRAATLTASPASASDPRDIEPEALTRAQVLTEGAIRGAILQHIGASARGSSIDIAMFYVADRSIIEALLEASRRDVTVRLILDPNEEAFGRPKGGIPNQPVASELVAASDGRIHVRWYRTHSEQFHTKLVMIYDPQRLWLTLGSANLTRRNLGDYNLEANVAIDVAHDSPLGTQALEYFETLWSNHSALGIEYTADFGFYADPSQLHYCLYRVMEGTGLSTF
jgi:phosphatidylserine/phosphatidylglycerophosphate/cardiolipin synthase-like enzyme